MATIPEQLFLYGEVVEPDPITGLTAMIAYADLTVGGSLVFAAIILASIICTYWGYLVAWASLGISTIRSYSDMHTITGAFRNKVLYGCIYTHLLFLISATIDWYFPFNRPITTFFRLASTAIGGVIGYFVLIPIPWYLSGLSDGFKTLGMESNGYCSNIFVYDAGVSGQELWKAMFYCTGEDAGFDIRTALEHDWNLSFLLDGEIHHLVLLSLVGLLFSSMLIFSFLFQVSAKTMALWRASKPCPETPVSESLSQQRELELLETIRDYEDLLDQQKKILATKTDEVEAANRQAEKAWDMFNKASASQATTEETRSHLFTENLDLRRELAEKQCLVTMSRARVREVEDEATTRIQSLCDKVHRLEEQLGEKREMEEDFPNIIESLKANIQVQNDQVLAIQGRLYASEARETKHREEKSQKNVEIKQLLDRNTTLISHNEQITAQYAALHMSYGEISQRLETALMTIQEKQNQMIILENELSSTRSALDCMAQEAHRSLTQTRQTENTLQQAMQDIKSACDSTIAQERAAAEQARKRAVDLSDDVHDLQTKVGLAMRDAQRSHEQAVNAQRTIEVLERRLARWEAPANSAQEIPKRQTGNIGSISTALAQSEVTISQQQTEIGALRRQLSESKTTSTDSIDSAMKQEVQKLRAALETERRARIDDQVRWDKRARELEADNQKLRISLSNAEASLGRRGGMRRPPKIP